MNDNEAIDPVVVAHRAGNHRESAAAAGRLVDVVEFDVHVHRGRVEVRHEKVLWPTSRLWERWFLLPADTVVPTLQETLDAVDPELEVMLDLKCFTRRAARQIRRVVGEERAVIASGRTWWVLGAFRSRPNTVRLRSCGTSRQLWLALRTPGLGDRVGIVAHERLLDESSVSAIRSKTQQLYTWAVRSVERGELLSRLGVTGLIVDDLDLPWPGLEPPADGLG